MLEDTFRHEGARGPLQVQPERVLLLHGGEVVFETLASGRDAERPRRATLGLKPIVHTSEIEWRTLLKFDDVEVICLQRICPLVWFILNGWRASCAVVPKAIGT